MAESAEMGRLMGFAVSLRSMMTTCAVSPTFSRTQMNLSDSIVSVLNPMFVALIPRFCSCCATIHVYVLAFRQNLFSKVNLRKTLGLSSEIFAVQIALPMFKQQCQGILGKMTSEKLGSLTQLRHCIMCGNTGLFAPRTCPPTSEHLLSI